MLPLVQDDSDVLEPLPVPDAAAPSQIYQSIPPYLRRVALVAGLGSLLFGYDTGVVSSALISIKDSLGGETLSTAAEEFIVTATTLGALVGAICAGWLSDRFGRKTILIVSSIAFTLGGVEQAAAQVLKELILGRAIVGIGVGLASSEVCPSNLRGRLVTLLVVLITFGQLLSYAVGAVFFNTANGWRWMFLSSIVPALAQLVLTFHIPESPRYLIKKGKSVEAHLALSRVYNDLSAEELERKIERIHQALDVESKTVVRLVSFNAVIDALWRDIPTRRALIVSCGLQFFQQATGFNSLMYYSGKILLSAGFAHPPLFAVFIAFSNWICTMITLRFIDRIGRRLLLLRTILGMIGGLLAMSFCFLFIKIRPINPGPDEPPPQTTAWSALALVSMVAFCCSYAFGLGNVPWVIQSELFAYNVRSVAGGISTATNWLANLVVAATTLHLIQLITTSGTFGLYAALSIAAWLFVYFRVPETAGLSIDESRKLFEEEGGASLNVTRHSDYQTLTPTEEEEEPEALVAGEAQADGWAREGALGTELK